MVHFLNNLKCLKERTIQWEKALRSNNAKELLEIEALLENYYLSTPCGYASTDHKLHIMEIETKRCKLFACEEASLKLKIKATWFQKGDCKYKYFHNFINHIIHTNSIWEIENVD